MIRNSTSKYKQKYQRSTSKGSQTMVMLPSSTKASIDHFVQTVATLPNFTRSASSKKLEKVKISNNKFLESSKFKIEDTFTQIKLTKIFKSKTRQSKKNKQQTALRSETVDGEKSEVRTYSMEFQERDSQRFIQKMPKNSLFYCSNCFQYVFDIEKSRHYPECKDRLGQKEKKSVDFYKTALKKLENIVQLSSYTNTKQTDIAFLFSCFLKCEVQQIQKIEFPKNYQFFKLQQIEMAFAHVYTNLLKGTNHRAEISIFTCY